MKSKILFFTLAMAAATPLSHAQKDEHGGKGGMGGLDSHFTFSMPFSIPTSNSNIFFWGNGEATITVTNSAGVTILKKHVEMFAGESLDINTSNLPKGIYFVIINDEEGKIIQQDTLKVD